MELIEKLKTEFIQTDLRFRNIELDNESCIEVSYFGHEVGGSYVHDWEVIPDYIKILSDVTNRKVEFIKRKSGMGADTYFFKVFKLEILDKDKYIPAGKIVKLDNAYFAFLAELWQSEFPYLHLLVSEVKNNLLLSNVGITINDSFLIVDGLKVAKIIDFENDREHYFKKSYGGANRTRFHATYDCLISYSDLRDLFFKKYTELINFYINKNNINLICEYSDLKFMRTSCFRIFVIFNNRKYNFETYSTWKFPSENDLIELLNEKQNYNFMYSDYRY